jgi:hypothetical protein
VSIDRAEWLFSFRLRFVLPSKENRIVPDIHPHAAPSLQPQTFIALIICPATALQGAHPSPTMFRIATGAA